MFHPKKVEPQIGQESVWDYPRPPKLEPTNKKITITFNTIVIAESINAKRVLETSHPPVYYIPQQDILMQYLLVATGSSFCEWKGRAIYYSLKVSDKLAERCAWSYQNPSKRFESIKDHIAFYAAPMDSCCVNDEVVTPQTGGFYGGWITKDIVGPFKGEPGSWGW